MKVERIATQSNCRACSGAIALKIDQSISKSILPALVLGGFVEISHFTQAGILYVENADLIATGSFGSNIIQTKCKKADCTKIINSFEELLTKI